MSVVDRETIVRLRKERGLSQYQAATVAGLSERTWQNLERGNRVSEATLISVAQLFDVDRQSLLVDETLQSEAQQDGSDTSAPKEPLIGFSKYWYLWCITFVSLIAATEQDDNRLSLVWFTLSLLSLLAVYIREGARRVGVHIFLPAIMFCVFWITLIIKFVSQEQTRLDNLAHVKSITPHQFETYEPTLPGFSLDSIENYIAKDCLLHEKANVVVSDDDIGRHVARLTITHQPSTTPTNGTGDRFFCPRSFYLYISLAEPPISPYSPFYAGYSLLMDINYDKQATNEQRQIEKALAEQP
ncbi:MAG: helix-turn-helix domain-containing protein [Alteromonadaceae bacterium]|nr:helix-turn-helix domain-containing protein [Alteromonadaceae bacterium]